MNYVARFFNHSEINLITTTVLIFASLYIAIISLLGHDFLTPLHVIPPGDPTENKTVKSTFIIFLLLFGGLFAAKSSNALRLPPLFGCLALGIVIRNVDVLKDFFIIPPFTETMIRKVALAMIVIRWGLATDVKFLYDNAVTPVTIGLVTAVGEIIAITVASFLILDISFIMAVFCALILVIVSPAVTVPAMISFKERGLGSSKRIPENVLAVCCVDNLFCVIVFMVLSSIIFTDAPIATTILMNAGSILLGCIGGIIIGLLLWRLPRPDLLRHGSTFHGSFMSLQSFMWF